MTEQEPVKCTPADDAREARYFVATFDPTGVMMTAHKFAEHLTLAEAKALQDEASRRGVMLLVYQEQDPATPKPEALPDR